MRTVLVKAEIEEGTDVARQTTVSAGWGQICRIAHVVCAFHFHISDHSHPLTGQSIQYCDRIVACLLHSARYAHQVSFTVGTSPSGIRQTPLNVQRLSC